MINEKVSETNAERRNEIFESLTWTRNKIFFIRKRTWHD